jgi:hypothetical protein
MALLHSQYGRYISELINSACHFFAVHSEHFVEYNVHL